MHTKQQELGELQAGQVATIEAVEGLGNFRCCATVGIARRLLPPQARFGAQSIPMKRRDFLHSAIHN